MHLVEMQPDNLLIVRVARHVSDADFNEILGRVEVIYQALTQPFVCVIDASMMDVISAERRKRLAEMEVKYKPLDLRYNRGQAYVVASAPMRGAITALHWLSPPVYPTMTFKSFEEACAWAKNKLAASRTT